LDWLNTLVGETRARLLGLVRRAALSISDLAESLGISENAVRTHIAAAERDGLVRQAGIERATGGKPARTYELTPAAEELFPKAYPLVFTELVRTLREDDGDRAAVARLRRVGRRLAAAARQSGSDDAASVHAAAALLESIGGSVEVVEEPDGWRIRASGCPLSGIVAADPDTCALAESLVAEVTGCPVVECCEKSARPRCEFRVARAPAGR
jgi:predicted ArsR family transcriptional regulator